MDESRDIELEKKIDAYLKGKLSAEEVDALWVELMKKPEYIKLLETEMDLKRLYRQKQNEQSTSTTYYWKWIAAAAAVALIVLSINLFDTNSHKPLQQWAAAEIDVSQNLASAEVTRSFGRLTPADSLLNLGFKEALEGNADRAREIYRRIVQEYNEADVVAKAYLNLGILQYNAGDFETSISSLNRAVAINQSDSLLTERSYWYLGNAYINTKQLQQARAAVQQAYNLGSIYKKEAYNMLRRLDYELGNIDAETFEREISRE